MATSLIARQTQDFPLSTGPESSPHVPHDIFIYSDSANRSSVTPRNHLASHKDHLPRLSSKVLPGHLIALPPLSSPTSSPSGQPSTPVQEKGDIFGPPRTDTDDRQAYRSWREGKAVYGGRVMGESRENVDIEKKIEATLPRSEHVANPRSRKASHYMRIFDQGNDNERATHGVAHGRVAGKTIGDCK